MADNFQAGDTAVLKSGGPVMTIDRIDKRNESDSHNSAWCTWFDEKKQPQSKWFPLTSLNKV
jgi:uncharacterized protein YodC (DUF2158 family)